MTSLDSSRLNSHTVSLLINFFFIFLIYLHFASHSLCNLNHPAFIVQTQNSLAGGHDSGGCAGGLKKISDHRSKCSYLKSHSECGPQGYIDYLQIFYCLFGEFPVLGHLVLTIWLFILFYLLGDTAASYFCPSLDSLSKFLKLSPIIAGVTLLSLGNGAPDVFSSIVSFARSSNGDVGLNSILGSTFFVSSFVVGTICLLIGSRDVSIDKNSFIRDVVFLLVSLSCLCLIVFIGEINLWFALSYVSIYFIYVAYLSSTHFFSRKTPKPRPVQQNREELAEMGIPLLGQIDDETPVFRKRRPQDLIIQDQDFKITNLCYSPKKCFSVFLRVLLLPLYLPRRLTIPVVCEDRWSRPCAVISTALAPIVVTELYSSQNTRSKRNINVYVISASIGLIFGLVAFLTTKKSNPPKKFSLVWLLGGFTMSVTWTYIIAQELVSLLVSLGSIFGISPSILGLTVLAWGNSLGDLIANLTMAMNGGQYGAQVALSGCYAGPLFNTVIGLGVPLVMSSFAEYPNVYVIPRDDSLLETLGFLMIGLLWALVIMPNKKMKLDKLVGSGLVALYLCFLSLRLARVFGIFKNIRINPQYHSVLYQVF